MSAFIFSCLVTSVGTLAWFASQRTAETTTSGFRVYADDAQLIEVNLIRFNYGTLGNNEFVDYLNPGNGNVGKYPFNAESGKFGYTDSKTSEFVPVDTMCLYDPLNLVISGGDLLDENTNSIFEVKLRTSSIENAKVMLTSYILDSKIFDDDVLKTSEYMDIDLYTAEDLATLDGSTAYRPSFYTDIAGDWNGTYDDYFRISYLSSLEASHHNFYSLAKGTDSLPFTPKTTSVEDDDTLTVYINVNYSPSRLADFETKLKTDKIKIFFDYYFSFKLEEASA